LKIPFGPAGSLTIFHVLCEPIAHECFSSVFILFHLVNPVKKGNWYAIYLLGIDTLKNRIIKMKIPMLLKASFIFQLTLLTHNSVSKR